MSTSDVKVLHINNLEPNHLNASPVKRNQNGGMRIDIEYIDPSLNNAIYLLQTPKCRLPFGMNEQGNDSGRLTYSLALSFDNYKDNTIENEFLRGIDQIDNHIKKLASENSKEWFKKPMKMDLIDELFKPSIKYSEDWPPLLKVKLPSWQGKFTCQFWNTKKQKIESDDVTKDCSTIVLIQLQSLWFVDKMFGCNWVAKQIQIYPSLKKSLKESCLIEAENDEFDIPEKEEEESDKSD